MAPAEEAPNCPGERATIVGTNAAKWIVGAPSADVIDAHDGNDIMRGRGGRDVLCGEEGNDRRRGGPGTNGIADSGRADGLRGGRGRGFLAGEDDADRMYGHGGGNWRGGADGDALLTVDSAADAVDGTPGDGECAAAGGACTLRAAIQEANAHPGSDSITLPAGLYSLEIPPLNANGIDSGDLDVSGPLTLLGAGATIDAEGIDRVLEVHDFAGSVRLEGVTLRGGSTPEYGGGLANVGAAEVALADVTLTGNWAGKSGSAIDNAITGSVALASSAVVANGGQLLEGGLGGPAITNRGVGAQAGSITILESTVAHNVSVGSDGEPGGGVWNAGDGTVTVERSLVTGNSSASNGAALSASGQGHLVLRDSVVSENLAEGSGGGIALLDKANGTISGSAVVDNVAVERGGGVLHESDGYLTVTASTIARNRAADGGGMLGAGTGLGELVLRQVGVTSNRADNRGGGVLLEGGAARFENVHLIDNEAAALAGNGAIEAEGGGGLAVQTGRTVLLADTRVVGNRTMGSGGGIDDRSDGQLWVVRSELSGNSAGMGGALASDSDAQTLIENTTISGNRASVVGGGLAALSGLTLRHVTVADNVSPAGPGLAVIGDALLSMTGSVIAGGCWFEAGGQPILSLGDNLATAPDCLLGMPPANPLLGPLAINGGPTHTHALLAGSPALELVLPVDCPPTDQRSAPRPFGLACDSGAFERGATPPPGPSPPPLPPPPGSGPPGSGGDPQPPGSPPGEGSGATPDRTAPVLSRLRLSRQVFRRAGGHARAGAHRRARPGTQFLFRLSEPARVRIAFKGRAARGRGVRHWSAGAIVRRAGRGRNRVAFGGGRLRPGRYRATLRAVDFAGNRSRPRRVTFRLVR